MTEAKVQFKGWQAIVVIVVLLGMFGARLFTFKDMSANDALMRNLERQLMSDYYPDETAKMKAAMETGNKDTIAAVAESVSTAKANVESVQASYPLFTLKARKEVVVKVTYSLQDSSGTRDRRTRYYLYNHGSIGNIWQYQHDTDVTRYYLNFL